MEVMRLRILAWKVSKIFNDLILLIWNNFSETLVLRQINIESKRKLGQNYKIQYKKSKTLRATRNNFPQEIMSGTDIDKLK